MSDTPFRSGFVSLVGRPNVGKSTLLNRILGEKLVITSDKPQTTRNRIQGICNPPGGQIVFIDTPGIHRGGSRLNKFMVDTAYSALQGVDIVLCLVEATTPPEKEEALAEILAKVQVPAFLVINKIDLVKKEELAKRIAAYASLHSFQEIVPVSSLTGSGVDRLVEVVLKHLPPGPAYFPDDILTDLPERFLVTEIVREKVFRLTHDEVPYAVAVVVDSFKERPDGLIAIAATINVERESQKGIIIGRKGDMLKKIGTLSRRDLEDLLQTKVFLQLFVRVQKDWSESGKMLKEFGYQ